MFLWIIAACWAGSILVSCATTGKPAEKGQFVLHVWIYYNQPPEEIQKVIDSSRVPFNVKRVKESDGVTRVEFTFEREPSIRQKEATFMRIKRYPGARGFATTRGEPYNK